MPDALTIGVLSDMAVGPDGEPILDTPWNRAIRLVVERTNEAGGIAGRAIELVHEAVSGAHEGLPERTVEGWRRLADRAEVLGILGPAITDNAVVLNDVIDARKVATIHWAGTEHARGEWYFQFPAGSLPDEGPALLRAIVADGHSRVGLLWAGTVGSEYAEPFLREAPLLGISITGLETAHVHQDDVTVELERLRRAQPDAVVFLGMGSPTGAFTRGLAALGWDVPRYGNIALLGAAMAGNAHDEGVVWVDQYEPQNVVLQQLEADYEQRWGERPGANFLHGVGRDLMTLAVEALRRAPNFSRAGYRTGLERVRQVPCAVGGRNPVMGFGPWQRVAIEGSELLMYRTIRDGRPVTYVPGAAARS